MSSEDVDEPNNGDNDSHLPSGAALMRVAGMGGGKTHKELEIMMVKKNRE